MAEVKKKAMEMSLTLQNCLLRRKSMCTFVLHSYLGGSRVGRKPGGTEKRMKGRKEKRKKKPREKRVVGGRKAVRTWQHRTSRKSLGNRESKGRGRDGSRRGGVLGGQ